MTTYDNKPEIFEANGDGSYTYRWSISAIDVEGTTKWECNEVIVWATVTSNTITQAVINALWGKDYEQKLLNDYNAARIGLVEGEVAEAYVQTYVDFLTTRKAVKAQINEDCELFNIQ